MYNKIIDIIKDKSLVLVGFGKEGKSSYKFIRKYLPNKEITIVDQNEKIYEQNDYLNSDKNVKVITGDNYLDSLNNYDLIIKSPGVKIPDEIFNIVKNKITSQLELILEVDRDNVIGVTGTKGKSTTSSLIYKVLCDQNKDCLLLGNVGNPILDYIDDIKEDTILVIECSSYQLENVKVSPHIGILLNLFEEHLNYHITLHNYWYSKLNIFKYQNSNDYMLFNSENDNVKQCVDNNKYNGRHIDLSKEYTFNNDDILYDNKVIYNRNNERNIIGEHNLKDILFVLRVSIILGLDLDKVRESIRVFKPLEHRMEYFGTYNNVKYYDDAIATIPEATINCIEALKDVDTLIFGGLDRGISYDMFIDYLNKSNVDNLIAMPDTGYKIADKIVNKKVFKVETLEEAVKIAKEVTKKICLLSPAAPSYNAFKNFEEKGNIFKELVKKD